MSYIQKTYVDYRNLGDTGNNNTSAIQPMANGEPATSAVLGRPSENLRSRTEIVRGTADDLLYYRDRTYRHLMEISGGVLQWEVGGVGRVNNTGNLTIRPFLTPRTNQKGALTTGTVAVNQLYYQVNGSAYATDGMNAITIEHRDVPGTVTPVVTISPGPVYRILVVFDSANGTHVASTIAGLLNTAIAGVPALAGKLTAVDVGDVTPIAVVAETPIDTRSHSGGLSGQATADVEAHVISSGFLGTFTTTNPLAEGDLIAIRYDYVIEPGTSPIDPKGGVPGGRAESNVARSNANVDNNLFIANLFPQWLPGAIPLCRVVNGNLHWVDGTVMSTGSTATPGAGLGTFIDSAVFSGLPTLIVNGGIDNSGSIDTIQEALVSVDQRLSQHRHATFVVTDGVASTGGAYNAATGLSTAIAACTNGGKIVVRRGTYTSGFPAVTTGGSITIEGETADFSAPGSNVINITNATTVTVNAIVHASKLSFTHGNGIRVTLARSVVFDSVYWQACTFTLGSGTSHSVELKNCTMGNVPTASDSLAALILNAGSIYAENCSFTSEASGTSGVVSHGTSVVQAMYVNCSFTSFAGPAFVFGTTGNTRGTSFLNCYFSSGSGNHFVIDIPATYVGGDITFTNCTFENTTVMGCVRALNQGGKVRFVNCTFLTSGSTSSGINTYTRQMVTANPGQAVVGLNPPEVIFQNCRADINQSNFTSLDRALFEFGSTGTTAGLVSTYGYGRVQVDGFLINFRGAGAELPPATVVILTGRAHNSGVNPSATDNVYNEIAVNHNAKTLPSGGATVGGQPPYTFYVNGLSPSTNCYPRLARNLSIGGALAPTSDGTAGGLLYSLFAAVDGFEVVPADSPNTNRFSTPQFVLTQSILDNFAGYVFNTSATTGIFQLLGGTTERAELLNSRVFSQVLNGGTFSNHVFYMDGGRMRNVTINNVSVNSAASSVVGIANHVATAVSNDLIGCEIYVPTNVRAVRAVGAAAATAGVRMRFEQNRVMTALTGAVALIDLGAAAPAGAVISNNIFASSSAAASSCVPDMSAVSDTTTMVKSNNTYVTGLPSPR